MRLALRGLRDMDDGSGAIEDADIERAVRAQAMRVLTKAVTVAGALTLAFLFLP